MSFTPYAGAGRSGFDGVGRSWWAAVTRAAERIRHDTDESRLDTLVRAASTLLGAPATAAILEEGQLVRRAVAGVDRSLIGTAVNTVGTLCGQVMGTARAVRCGDALAAPGVGLDVDCCPGARSALSVPLVVQGRVLGVVSVTGDRIDRFGEADEQALFVLADAAACGVAERAACPPRAEEPAGGRVPVQARSPGPVPAPAAEATANRASPTPVGGRCAPEAAEAPAPPREPGLRGVGLWQWDAVSGELSCSPQVGAALGVPVGHRIGLDVVRDLLHPDDLGRFDESLLHHVGRRRPVEGHYRVVTSAGQVRHLHAWSDLRVEDGRIAGAFGGVADLTARQADVGALRSSRIGLRAAQELTGIAFWEWAPARGRLTWSPGMFRLAGMAPGMDPPTLERWHRLVHPDDLPRVRDLDEKAADRQGGLTVTFRIVGADGVPRHLRAWSETVHLADGTHVVQGAAVDVTRQVQDRLRLDRLSATDSVTGLANRVAFERRITQLLADPSRDVALLLLDLDRFKLVNDSLGHQVGDRLLVEVARRLAAVVPGGSLTARMGGDEFVVVPRPGIGWVQVRRLAQVIVETLRQPYVLPETGEMLVCPVSVGVTGTSGREVGAEELLSEADLALYQAKDSGRDRYVVYDDALRSRARGRHLAEQMLRSALERGRLTLQYQPIADLRTGKVVGAEALVRIDDPAGGGLVRPDVFIEVAEDTGLVVELDCWVIETALTQLTSWMARRRGRHLPWLAVNVSARSMEQPQVVQRLLDGLRRRDLPSRSIKVELTEHSFLAALPRGEGALRELISSGVPVGIDDFGTGYSALGYLQRFDLDFMKIDRSFVASVGEQPRADAVVTAIVGLAHAHGMQVTAEGIEKPAQAQRLAEIGCDFAQGYHVGRPVAPSRLWG
jgi:diguanylate cyclase (GGDEF)-like protein